MARRVKKKYRVYAKKGRPGVWEIWTSQEGKNCLVPREAYSHLDGQPKHNVEHWITGHLDRPEHKPLSDDDLTKLVEEFVAYYRDELERASETYEEHERHLLHHVIPYFLKQDPPLRDPNKWPSVSVRMSKIMSADGLTKHQIYRSNVALRRFYEWLREEERVLKENVLLTRGPNMKWNDEITPCKVFLSPSDVVAKIKAEPDLDAKRLLALGYFFSLRPQEMFGLKAGDFFSGPEVFELEAAKTMRDLDLYGGTVVDLQRQKTKLKKFRRPKKGSGGWVACISAEASNLLVDLLDGKGPDDPVFDTEPYDLYRDHWPYKASFTLKDLRRASLYWIGHNSKITLIQLSKHARQKASKSLEYYLRRPEEKLKASWKPLQKVDLGKEEGASKLPKRAS